MNTHKIAQKIKKSITDYSSINSKYKSANVINMLLIFITLMSLTYAFSINNTQKQLKALIEMQSTKITELAKINKDIHSNQKNTEAVNSNSMQSLNTLVNELMKLKEEETKKVSTPATSSTTSAYKGILSINSPEPVNIYSNASIDSSVITTAAPNAVFFYFVMQDGWYQVEIQTGKLGWVQQQFIQELPNQ